MQRALKFPTLPTRFRIILFVSFLSISAQSETLESETFFYRNLPYGSESLINPLTLILQGGFGILKIESRSSDPADVHYAIAWKNLRENLLHPIKHVREYGTHNFVYEQIIPFSVNNRKAYYWPNYTMHVLGGGMSYRMMKEWFRLHEYPYPTAMAFGTIMAYHLLNEIVENNDFVGTNVDPIADIYIFNPLGMLLFSVDGISRFFSEKLQLSDWSFQIAYDPWNHVLMNNGQNFMMRYPLTKSKRIHLMYVYGNHGEVGISYRANENDYFSMVGGFSAQRLISIGKEATMLELTTNLVGSAGFFYDRNRSLLFSLFYTKSTRNMLQLNVYPGLFRFPFVKPGFFFILGKNKKGSFGITLASLPIQPGRRF